MDTTYLVCLSVNFRIGRGEDIMHLAVLLQSSRTTVVQGDHTLGAAVPRARRLVGI